MTTEPGSRDWRLAALLAMLVAIFFVDVALPSVEFTSLLVVPAGLAAAFAPVWFIRLLAALAAALAAVASALNGYLGTSSGWVRLIVIVVLLGVAAVVGGTLRARDAQRAEAVKELGASERRYRLLTENASDVVLWTRQNAVVWVSPALTAVLGWSPEDWIGRSMADFGHHGDRAVIDEGRDRVLSGSPTVMRLRLKDEQQQFHWVEVHAQAFRDADGHEDGIVSSFRVVDGEVKQELELLRRATVDEMTGLVNRREVMERLSWMLAHPGVDGTGPAALFCDVDDLKRLNDAWGHAVGDVVLRETADRLRRAVRNVDVVARLGGDEFVVILDGVHSRDEAAAVAEGLQAAMGSPIAHPGGSIVATLSIGVTLARPGDDLNTLISRADTAMYEAKGAGKNRIVVCEADDSAGG